MTRNATNRNKRRTREHIIADLSINYVERQVLLSGNTVERRIHDYGIDLVLSTYGKAGEPEPGIMSIQVKATDELTKVSGGRFATCRIERAHLRAWLAEPMPVFLVLYDATNDRAYWLYVQAAFGGTQRFQAAHGSEQLTIRFPVKQVLTPAAVQRFRAVQAAIVNKIIGVVYPNE